MKTTSVLQAVGAAAISAALIACTGGSGDAKSGTPAASAGTAAATAAAAAASKLDTSLGTNGVLSVPLAAGQHSRFMAITTAPDGKMYAAGFTGLSGGDQALAVARFDAAGALDKSFGKDGVASVNVAIGGKAAEIARGVVVQSSGKIVIAGPVEHDPTASGDAAKDTDVALVRFDSTGKLDTTFGKGGVAVVDYGTGKATSATTFVADTSWGLGTLTGDKLVLWGSKLTDVAGKTNTDYIMMGFTDAGAVDTGFGTGGKVVVNTNGAGSSSSPRNLLVQPDGKIVATGYSEIDGVVQPVLVRMDAKGQLDKAFGKDGVATNKVLAGVTESYNLSLQGSDYIMAGYGRGADATEKVDLVVYRFKANGTLDASFGTDGKARVDIAKEDDRARNVMVLPNGNILAAGSGKKTAANVDGMLVLMDKDGKFINEFGDKGALVLDLGGPADSLYGMTLSADKKSVFIAGYKGIDATSGGQDTAVLVKLTI